MNITKSSLRSARKLLWPPVEPSLVPSTPNCRGLPPPLLTVRKKRRVLANLSNMELDQSAETLSPIGTPYGPPPLPMTSWPFPQASEFKAIGHYELLLPIFRLLLRWNEKYMYTGERLVLVNQGEPGMKQDWMLIAKIHGLNSGMDIKLKKMLSSTSFVEVSMLPTFSDGAIVIQSEWRQKALQDHWRPRKSGLPQTLTQETGIPTWTPKPKTP